MLDPLDMTQLPKFCGHIPDAKFLIAVKKVINVPTVHPG